MRGVQGNGIELQSKLLAVVLPGQHRRRRLPTKCVSLFALSNGDCGVKSTRGRRRVTLGSFLTAIGGMRVSIGSRLTSGALAYDLGARELDDVSSRLVSETANPQAVSLWVCSHRGSEALKTVGSASMILAAVETKTVALRPRPHDSSTARPSLGAVGRLELLPASTWPCSVVDTTTSYDGSRSRSRSPTEGARRSPTRSAL